MKDEWIISEEEASVIDLLEQIKNLNELLNIHKQHQSTPLMIQQYEDMKAEFLSELTGIFRNYDLQVIPIGLQAV